MDNNKRSDKTESRAKELQVKLQQMERSGIHTPEQISAE
jgi:hypothetical protein